MHGHFIEKCEKCGVVINQCRCMDQNKEVRWAVCLKCAKDGVMDDSVEKYTAPKKPESFEEKLVSLINRCSIENESNTPDFILAQYISGCLQTFTTAVQQRETWYGRDPRPSHTRRGKQITPN